MGHLDIIGAQGRQDQGSDADRLTVHRCIEGVRACIAERRAEDTKLLLAQLLFDFQPLIIRDTGLKAIIVALLDQCDASSLRQRLLIATGASEGFPAAL
jgi:hypothetical protein